MKRRTRIFFIILNVSYILYSLSRLEESLNAENYPLAIVSAAMIIWLAFLTAAMIDILTKID